LLLTGLLLILTPGLASAQQPSPSLSTAGSPSSSTAGSDTSVSSAGTPGADSSLSAAQIIELLQQKPELMVDLKNLAAEQLQAQGTPIQADSITDEMMLGKIASDASVRANIT